MKGRMSSLQEIAEVLRRSRRMIICGHVMPDGDCLGSVLALGLAMEEMGKQVTMVSPDPVPEALDFLPAANRIRYGGDGCGDCDVFVALDCSVPERLGPYRSLIESSGTVVNIDHHDGAVAFGDMNYMDKDAAATGEIVFDLLELLGFPLNVSVGSCLYVAIATDTGSFQYENTTSQTHRRVARLLDCGVPAARLNILAFGEKPLIMLKVLEAALGTLELSPCGKVAWISVTRKILDRLLARDEHTDGLINYPRLIRGVEVALLFREISEGKFKVGFRSKGLVDVNRLAGIFGGGGHSRASGCILEGNLEEVKRKVVAAAVKAVAESSGDGLTVR